jgi:membrane fusion protein
MTMMEEHDAPFLENAPPPWVARGSATVLLLLVVSATVAAVFVHVPETVSATFVLAPVRGGDPIRAFRSGVVTEVYVTEARTVRAEEPMFTIASSSVADRSAERGSLESQIVSGGERLANRRESVASQRRADDEESRKLQGRLESLARTIDIRRKQLALAVERARAVADLFALGLSSRIDLNRAQSDADTFALELEAVSAEHEETRRSLERLQHEINARIAESRETERSLLDEIDRARIRRAALDQDPVHDGAHLTVAAPCDGSVLSLNVRNRGAIVQEGEVLGEVACKDERLQAELMLPENGSARVRRGQTVRLLYDKFPYQRYGTRRATIHWISPASTSAGLRALASVDAQTIIAAGETQALVPGMTGRARVVVGTRTLAGFAFEPIREVREDLFAAQ